MCESYYKADLKVGLYEVTGLGFYVVTGAP
jgi:hypothetical protein